ncbi:DUF1127 domain-containing protein [Tropicibacter naphthalenivorans]|uniref:YjiS-like domain-containing protein n=1 Tax=Tropicibacter naphthalenivorans TaxID=441103 RepID=A0A0P1GNF2_9RHOB|nr:DUF1127 domain-containing protein [Tropicibacter naphthalenivorans]CUH77266.1 hypothetical protein TRN7648_01384 [Tropicibacter naphthalenivorans]SMC59397.1 Uncharacterized conserved protein YjiS, DUF1127 family [Tropicibacter naphthalenivorans]
MAPIIAPRPALAYLDRSQPLPVAAEVALRFAVAVTKWSTRRATRNALKTIEPHLLDDIGLTRQQAMDEAHRPFWAE